MKEQRFKDVVALRGQTFRNNLEIYIKLAKLDPLTRRGSICEVCASRRTNTYLLCIHL